MPVCIFIKKKNTSQSITSWVRASSTTWNFVFEVRTISMFCDTKQKKKNLSSTHLHLHSTQTVCFDWTMLNISQDSCVNENLLTGHTVYCVQECVGRILGNSFIFVLTLALEALERCFWQRAFWYVTSWGLNLEETTPVHAYEWNFNKNYSSSPNMCLLASALLRRKLKKPTPWTFVCEVYYFNVLAQTNKNSTHLHLHSTQNSFFHCSS